MTILYLSVAGGDSVISVSLVWSRTLILHGHSLDNACCAGTAELVHREAVFTTSSMADVGSGPGYCTSCQGEEGKIRETTGE